MKILGNRVLVSKIEEPKKEGFQTVDVQDSFVNKGRVEQVGIPEFEGMELRPIRIKEGDTVIFAKYSPDTQEIKYEDKTMKVVKVEDIIAVL